jgi:transcriptional regulator with XRE-family HTH domain
MSNDMKTRKKIAKTIKELREYHNQICKYARLITQERIADFLEIPLEEYKKIESGKKSISVVDLKKLANLFDVPLIYFIDKRKCKGIKLTPYKICGKQNNE